MCAKAHWSLVGVSGAVLTSITTTMTTLKRDLAKEKEMRDKDLFQEQALRKEAKKAKLSPHEDPWVLCHHQRGAAQSTRAGGTTAGVDVH